MVLIPYALTYTTTLQGTVPKLVRCESCAFEYVYLLEANVAGESTSFLFLDNEGARQRLATDADAALRQNRDHGIEVVPCPNCGLVQTHMLARACGQHRLWMRTAGLITLAAAGILVALAIIYTLIDAMGAGFTALTVAIWAVLFLVFNAGLGLIFLRSYMANQYDPNGAPAEIRIRLGQELAVSKEEYLKIIREP